MWIYLLLGSAFFLGPLITQANQSRYFSRIYDGDYVWSIDFPEQERSLIAYGYALFKSIQEACPGVLSQSEIYEVGFFIDTVAGNNQFGMPVSAVFLRSVTISAANRDLRASAISDLDNEIEVSTCNSPRVSRVSDNVWRMLAGRNPQYRAESVKKPTLTRQSVVPLAIYHQYPGAGISLAGGAPLRVFERDVSEMNTYKLTVLECRYDKFPDDEIQEEQYYWGPSLVAQVFSPMPIVWQSHLESSQDRMDRAIGWNGREKYRAIHPFTTYGSPRAECPSFRDPKLRFKEIEVITRAEWDYQAGPCVMQENGSMECPD